MKHGTAWKKIFSVLVAVRLMQTLAPAQGVDAGAAERQVWRAYGGHAITAEFIEIKAGAVVLKGEDGTMRQVALTLLIPEDQARAKKLDEQKRSAPSHAVAKAAAGKLPLFSEGPGKGFFAVYTHENFVAQLGADAVLRVQCMENGTAVGKPLQVYLWSYYKDPDKKDQRRTILSFKEEYTPVIQPNRLLIEGLMKDGVQFGLGLKFKDNQIETWGWVEDPKGIAQPTECYPVCSFAKTHTFPADLLVVEQKKILAPFSMKVEPLRGKAVVHPYGDRAQGFNQPSKSVEILGPVFGGRKVSLSLISSKACDLRVWNRAAVAPVEGFDVRLQKEDPKSRDEKLRMILTID